MVAAKLNPIADSFCILTPLGMQKFLKQVVEDVEAGYKIYVCEIVEICHNVNEALNKYRNKAIKYHQVNILMKSLNFSYH